MARKFLTSIDLVKNELQNAVIQNLAVAPSSPAAGQVYYNTVDNQLYIYNGTRWEVAGNAVQSGVLASRPAVGTVDAGSIYYATDNYLFYYSNGSTWQQASAFGVGESTAVSITGTAGNGTSTNYSRADHTHAGPGFGNVTTETSYGLASSNGSAATVARADHTHGTPALTGVTPQPVTATTASVGTGTAPAREDHVHAFTPANFPLSTFGVPTSDVAFNAKKITGLADPIAAQDAATKAYVDATSQGLNVHTEATIATTVALVGTYANGTADASGGLGINATFTITATGATVVDTRTLLLNDRVLLKNQASAVQNGMYIVTTAGTTGVSTILTRAEDSNNSIAGELGVGDFFFIADGSQAATGWVQTATGTATTPPKGIKIGTDNITFTQFSGAGTYTASNGVALTGTNFTFVPLTTGGLQTASGGGSIKLATNSGAATDANGFAIGAGNGIVVGTSTISVDATVVARKLSATLSTSATSYTVTHNLGTLDVHVQVYAVANGEEVMVDNLRATINTVTINFNVAPTANTYRVVVIG